MAIRAMTVRFISTLLMNAGERGDDQRGPLRPEISIRAVRIPFAEGMSALGAAASANANAGNTEADRNVRIGARRGRRRREAERLRGIERGAHDRRRISLRAGRADADGVDHERQFRGLLATPCPS